MTMQLLKQAQRDGHIAFAGEGKNERIQYVHAKHSERWSDPEEKVRAAFFADLIYHYRYDPKRIDFEVEVPRRTSSDKADIVLFRDDDQKEPYFVFECKRSDVSDAEFAQAVEQACGNRANLAAPFRGAISGLTRRLLRFDKFPPLERDRNTLTDIPARYGNPPVNRFFKNKNGQDLGGVGRKELRDAIRKCH